MRKKRLQFNVKRFNLCKDAAQNLDLAQAPAKDAIIIQCLSSFFQRKQDEVVWGR